MTRPRAAYVPDADALGALARRGGLPSFAFSHLKYVRTNAIPSAPVAGETQRFPLLVLATGLSGFRQYNTLGVEELVSHGYVVAGIGHPYSSAAVVSRTDASRTSTPACWNAGSPTRSSRSSPATPASPSTE
jgi:predicted dienelactone hydrolase